jgi:hypothetical protein
MKQNDITLLVTHLLARAPDWIGKDLSAKDPALRTRAEEAMATLISAAISEGEFRADRS